MNALLKGEQDVVKQRWQNQHSSVELLKAIKVLSSLALFRSPIQLRFIDKKLGPREFNLPKITEQVSGSRTLPLACILEVCEGSGSSSVVD